MAPRDADLAGERIGHIYVIKRVERHGVVTSSEWLCVCACGEWVVRFASYLLHAKQDGADVTCRECWLEKRRESREARRKKDMAIREMGRRRIAKEQWTEDGLILLEMRVAEDARRDLVEAFGSVAEDGFSNDDIDPWFYDR